MDAIYFDLDGTLTDPKPGITRSIQYALQRLDHPTMPTEDELTWCIGPPLRTSFVRLLSAETSADLAVSYYRERFSDIGLYENGVYDGIGEVLTSLCASGHRLSASRMCSPSASSTISGCAITSSACSVPNSTAPVWTSRIC